MTANKEDFFIPANSVYNISDEEYERMELLLNATRAFARATHQCVYVIDYFRKGFLYVSDDIEVLCGEPVEKVQEFGYDLYMKHVPEEEVQMLLEINREGFKMANAIEPEERKEYTISYDFHLINGKKKQLINHTLTPILMTRDGRIWLALCTIAPSTKSEPGNVVLKKQGGKLVLCVFTDETPMGNKGGCGTDGNRKGHSAPLLARLYHGGHCSPTVPFG